MTWRASTSHLSQMYHLANIDLNTVLLTVMWLIRSFVNWEVTPTTRDIYLLLGSNNHQNSQDIRYHDIHYPLSDQRVTPNSDHYNKIFLRKWPGPSDGAMVADCPSPVTRAKARCKWPPDDGICTNHHKYHIRTSSPGKNVESSLKGNSVFHVTAALFVTFRPEIFSMEFWCSLSSLLWIDYRNTALLVEMYPTNIYWTYLSRGKAISISPQSWSI